MDRVELQVDRVELQVGQGEAARKDSVPLVSRKGSLKTKMKILSPKPCAQGFKTAIVPQGTCLLLSRPHQNAMNRGEGHEADPQCCPNCSTLSHEDYQVLNIKLSSPFKKSSLRTETGLSG